MLQADPPRAEPQPIPANLRSTQPGGGKCYSLELAWGHCRRAWLKKFRPGYVRRMAERMTGSTDGAPWEILDPRDLKYARNQCTANWAPEHDPFRWRNHVGFARWGLCELLLMGGFWSAATVGLLFLPDTWKWFALIPGVVFFLIVWFFRDPPRRVATEPGLVVSPADGKLVEVTPLAHHDFVGGPAYRIGIFLSIFNVHINRAPVKSRVVQLQYSPGKFLNALDPESALLNENLWIGLEEDEAPHRKMVVRQISGLIARRIVCDLRPGEVIERGHKFGMIKFGSRTELILPQAGFELLVKPGQMLQAGSTVLGRYSELTS